MIFTKIQAKMLALQNREISTLNSYLYTLYYEHIIRNIQASHVISQLSVGPENTNRAVCHAITNPYPMSRYLVGIDARIMFLLVNLVPSSVFDLVFYYLGF